MTQNKKSVERPARGVLEVHYIHCGREEDRTINCTRYAHNPNLLTVETPLGELVCFPMSNIIYFLFTPAEENHGKKS